MILEFRLVLNATTLAKVALILAQLPVVLATQQVLIEMIFRQLLQNLALVRLVIMITVLQFVISVIIHAILAVDLILIIAHLVQLGIIEVIHYLLVLVPQDFIILE